MHHKMDSFYSRNELSYMGFLQLGENVLISRKTSIYSHEKISIGNHVRIDDFCLLSGNISIGSYVHIAAFCGLYGGNREKDECGIIIGDFSTTSSRVCIYALSDDYSGNYLTNPMIPDIYKNVQYRKVELGKHTIIGTGSTILPTASLADGTAIGAMSLVISHCKSWTIYAGIPAKELKPRSRKVILLEDEFLQNEIMNDKEKS